MMIKESENLIVEEHKHIVKIKKQEKKERIEQRKAIDK